MLKVRETGELIKRGMQQTERERLTNVGIEWKEDLPKDGTGGRGTLMLSRREKDCRNKWTAGETGHAPYMEAADSITMRFHNYK